MPWLLQVLSNVAVAKFFLVICRGIVLKGTGLEALWVQFVWMILFAFLLLAVSIRRMSTRGNQ